METNEKMDFDLTQAVTQSDTEGEDEENSNSAPVAHIKVLNQPCLKKKLYPIHKGDNTIGRHDLCQVSVPVRSLSKKHACIEVRGRSHFIFDMGSRNRTRRGTHYLTPEVRYELRNNDVVVFADVSCIYLIEDSARASDSGSETDPMSDSETVFHTVAVNMYNPGVPTVNRAVEPELIEVAVASDPNSCDSAASSDILLPTQDFTISKIRPESQNQAEAVQGSESPVIKNSRKEEAIRFLVADSESENEQDLSKELRFQNNGNHEDSLDMDLLAAATQAYVADSEDDDNKSEILDMVQSEFIVADTQPDNSPKPTSKNSEECTDAIKRNGSASPSSPIITSFATNSPRTYSKKDASNKSSPKTVPSKSIDIAKDEEKPIDEFEETQDPNLFAMSTLIADEYECPPTPGNKSPLASPKSDKNATLNTTVEEADTVPMTADDKDTLPVDNEVATILVNDEEAATVPFSKDVVTSDNLTNNEGTSDQAATLVVADTIPVSSQNDVTVLATKDDDNTNSILNDETATLVVSGEDVATVQVTTDETMFVGMDIDVGRTETIEVDPLPEELPKQKQSKVDNSDVESPLKLTEESNNAEAESLAETYKTNTPSKELPSSSSLISVLSDGEVTSESKKSPLLEAETNKKKESCLNTEHQLLDKTKTVDVPVSIPVLHTPSTKDKLPKISSKSDDEALEATQPYTINCLDNFSPVRRDNVKAKKTLPFSTENGEECVSDIEEDTQPYVEDDKSVRNTEAVGSQSPAFLMRGGDHEISDEEEDSIRPSQKRKCLKKVTSSQEAKTLSLSREDENDTDKVKLESKGSQTARSAVWKFRVKEMSSMSVTKEATSTETQMPSLKAEQMIQDVKIEAESSKIEESLSENKEKLANLPEELLNLSNAEMTETEPSEIMNSEAACSLSVAPIALIEKQITKSGSKDSEESREIAITKGGRRSRKRKTSEEKESTKNMASEAEQSPKTDSAVGAKEQADDKAEETSSNTKKTRRSVHFVGVSSSEEDLEEATNTPTPCSRRSLRGCQESEAKAVGTKKKGRPPKNVKAKKDAKMIDTTDSEESSMKDRRSRGRKSKTDDNENNQKDSQTTGNTENDNLEESAVIVNQRQNKRLRSSTPFDKSSEINSTLGNSTIGKKSRGRKSKVSDQKKEEFETLGNTGTDQAEEMTVDKKSSEEMPILENEVLKEVKLEILKKSSEVTSGTTSTLKEEVPEQEAKDDASKLSMKKIEDRAEKISEKEKPAKKIKDQAEEDSPKVRTSRAIRSQKSIDEDAKSQKSIDEDDKSQKSIDEDDKSQKSIDEDVKSQKSVDEDEKEENINGDTKTKVTKVSSDKRVSRSSRSKAISNTKDDEMVPENDSTTEPTPREKRGRQAKTKKTDSQESEIASEEPPASKRASRSTRRTSQEEKVPEDTCTTSRRPRNERAKKGKDQENEEDAVEVTVKTSKRQTRKCFVESADIKETVGTRRGHPKSKISQNSNQNTDTIVNDEKNGDDNDDFVVPVSREQSSERMAVSLERASSSSSQRNSSMSSDSFQDSEIAKLVKQEPKTPISRKRSQSSQSSSQDSPLTTPKRKQLNSFSSPGTPSSRSSSSSFKPKVMFTGVADDKLQKIVTELGGSVVTSFDSCTHLVTDKIRRTVKFLCCLARGIPIVSPSWLTNCKAAKVFIDHTSHIVSDPTTEKQYKFTLKNSLQQARNGPLLENYKIHVTKSVKPNVDQMKEIMVSCKAQYLKRMPNEEEEKTIVISCEEDRTLCQPALNAGIPIVNAEFILTGILQYDISVSKYQIFDSSSGNKRKPSETDKGNATAKRRRR